MSNPSYIRSGLVRRGLPEHVADAFMVNFRDESGLNPGINEAKPLVAGSRGGFGLYQLTGPRRREYEAFAAQRGVQPADVDAQLDFLMGELSGSEKRAGQRILAAPDTATAAQAIVNDFLRPAASHRTKRSAQYASLGGAPMALSPEPSPSGAASALQSVMADRSSPSPSSPPAGGSMSTPTVNIGLKPERSTKLYDVMLERAMAAGSRSRNAWDVAGNLVQVWAANSEKKEAEAENASSLQEALAGLDPEYAAAAQLTGTREGAAQAFLSQAGDRREAARRAEDAARRQEETAYQRGRDTVSDQQWQAEQERLAQGTIPAGYRRTASGLEAIPGGPADAPAETFRQATPEQAAQYGASGGQFGPDGRFYPINPPSGMSVETMPDGTMRMIQGPGAGKPGGALTEGQSKDAVFSTRARGALPTIDEFGEALTNPIAQGAAGLPGGNYMVGENFQRAQQAGNEFLQAILRKDTGAAITSQEVAEYGSVYLPRPGDSPATLQQKQQSRQRALAAIEAGMPPAAILQQEQALIQSGTPGAVQQRDENGVPVGGMGGSAPAAPAPSPMEAPIAPSDGTMPMVTSQQAFDALPSGTTFVAPDGSVRRKP